MSNLRVIGVEVKSVTRCRFDGCVKEAKTLKVCNPHYRRWLKAGKPEWPEVYSRQDKFWDSMKANGACLEWQLTINEDGYGVVGYEGEVYKAHRKAYELWFGSIPEGYHVDHLCGNRKCCAPWHLEAVTPAENRRRAARMITHCPQGHRYSLENTRMRYGRRNCKACHRVASLTYARKRYAKDPELARNAARQYRQRKKELSYGE